MPLPPPRGVEARYSIAMLCLGNICRSPTAQVVLTAKLAASPLATAVEVHSSGTGDWHVGEGMDRRAAATLTAHGYDPSLHRARQFDSTWFDEHDLILAMDSSNLRNATALAPDDETRRRVVLFRTFDPLAAEGDLDVPDPWYSDGEGFNEVMSMVERTTDALVAELRALLVDDDV